MAKRILVAGSSIAAGMGFIQGINDPDTWPNQLQRKLGCDLDNVSSAGYDCTGIFFLASQKIFLSNYDLILIEIPPLNRVIARPNTHGFIEISGKNTYEELPNWHYWFQEVFAISKKDWNNFCRVMVSINTNFEHWKKLIGVIVTAQILIDKGYNIKFINNSLHWDQDFFTYKDSKFARCILPPENYLRDQDIQSALTSIEQEKKLIELKHWINPFNSLRDIKIDQASDGHPGKLSNDITSDMIINFISK